MSFGCLLRSAKTCLVSTRFRREHQVEIQTFAKAGGPRKNGLRARGADGQRGFVGNQGSGATFAVRARGVEPIEPKSGPDVPP
jgi:hypothetical protein